MKLIQEINKENKNKSWIFEKLNKIDKPLSNLNKKQRRHILLKSEMKEGTSIP